MRNFIGRSWQGRIDMVLPYMEYQNTVYYYSYVMSFRIIKF